MSVQQQPSPIPVFALSAAPERLVRPRVLQNVPTVWPARLLRCLVRLTVAPALLVATAMGPASHLVRCAIPGSLRE